MAEANPTFVDRAQQEVEYRDVPGFPGYRVGSDGSVWSCWQKTAIPTPSGRCKWGYRISDTWRRLKPDARAFRNNIPYQRVRLSGRYLLVHTVVLLAFHGPRPDGMVCRHLDGDHNNNSASNLAWGTYGENIRDKTRHDRTNHGEKNSQAVLTHAKVAEIRTRYAAGAVTLTQLAEEYGVTFQSIGAVISGRTWRKDPMPPSQRKPRRKYKRGQPSINAVPPTGLRPIPSGLRWDAKKRSWMARIKVDGARLFVGCFDTQEEGEAAMEAARWREEVLPDNHPLKEKPDGTAKQPA